MSEKYFPIQFKYPKSNKCFTTTLQTLYHEYSLEERSRFLKKAQEHQCEVTCHCRSKHPIPLSISHKGTNYFLKNRPNEGYLHQRQCPLYLPPSEKHTFWEPVNGHVKLPFSIERTILNTQAVNHSTVKKQSVPYKPTFKQFYEQLFIQTHTHFLYTALKKEQSILPTSADLHFYLTLKLKQFDLQEGNLSDFYLETLTFTGIQKKREQLAQTHLLNWEQARLFVAHVLTNIACFKWKQTTYTCLTLLNPATKTIYRLAYSGDLCQSLQNKFQRSVSELLEQSQLWFVGWLPVKQHCTPVFNGKKLPLLSPDSQVLCLALNGCLTRNPYELKLFNTFANDKQPLRKCFYGESHPIIKGETLPNALWVGGTQHSRTYESIYIVPPYQKETDKEKIRLQLETESPELWVWDVKKHTQYPPLPYQNLVKER